MTFAEVKKKIKKFHERNPQYRRLEDSLDESASVLLLLMGESIAEAQDGTVQKKPRVYTVEKLKNLKSGDLKDTDIIDVRGKRLTVAETRTLIQKELHVGDPKNPQEIAQGLLKLYQRDKKRI